MDMTSTEQTVTQSAKKRLPRGEKGIRRLALRCVVEMIADEKAKSADRLSAVKTLMDYFLDKGTDGEELRIVFENLPDGFAE